MKGIIKEFGCGCLFIPGVYVLIFLSLFRGCINENIKHRLIYKNPSYEKVRIIDSVTVFTPETPYSTASYDDYFILTDSSRIIKYNGFKVGDSILRVYNIDKSGVKHKIYLPNQEKISEPSKMSLLSILFFVIILFIPVFFFTRETINKIHLLAKEKVEIESEESNLKLVSYYLDSYFILFVSYITSIALFLSAYSDFLSIEKRSLSNSTIIILLKILISIYIPVIMVYVVGDLNKKKKDIYWFFKIIIRIVGYGNILLALVEFYKHQSLEQLSIVKLFIYIFNNFKEVF